jgi:hypothetical protein
MISHNPCWYSCFLFAFIIKFLIYNEQIKLILTNFIMKLKQKISNTLKFLIVTFFSDVNTDKV